MPYCPTHGLKEGRFCPDCGSELLAAPPSGDSLHIRSPEAHANASVNPTFILPGAATGGGPPILVKCPKCGHRNSEADVFDCQGPCGRATLCRRHFDDEYDVCKDCAAERRGVAQQEVAQQAKLQADLAEWRGRAERTEKELAQAEARIRVKTEEALRAQAELGNAQTQGRQAQTAATTATAEWQAQRATLEKALTEWRSRAERAEVQLAEIARRERAAEVTRQSDLRRKEQEVEQARLRQEETKEQTRRTQEGPPRILHAVVAAEVVASDQARRAEEAKSGGSISPSALWQRIGIELIRIPAGEFLYGDGKRKVMLPEFWIAKTPVTNVQYKAFVDVMAAKPSSYFRPPHHWQDGQIPKGKENHPVVYVDWNDAQKFCAWVELRLPTEQEWEKAARGMDGREYPWGAWQLGRCNSVEAKIGDTSPVGRFPSGASPYGLLDMAGNVWEWCADWYDSGHHTRVLRGGSFRSETQYVRCAFRHRLNPAGGGGYYGFRVASSGL